jgi:hypothetical protein
MAVVVAVVALALVAAKSPALLARKAQSLLSIRLRLVALLMVHPRFPQLQLYRLLG